MNKIKYIAFLLLLLVVACGKKESKEIKTPETIFNEALEYFNNENYFKAKQKLDVIKLQYPASEFAEKAQYYLAECEYYDGNFIIAAFNYNNLRRLYPSTSYAKESMFKAAKCYYRLSPTFERDQEYTKKAIESLQEFQYIYPSDSLAVESGKLITELRDKLGHREYQNAYIYRRLESPRSALIYYDEVINNYDDTKYYEDAFFGKIEVLYTMKKYEEAKGIIDLYMKKFSEGKFLAEVNRIKNEISNISDKLND